MSPQPSAVPSAPATVQAWIGHALVRHRRLRPRPHQFAYPSWCVLLPMRALAIQPVPDQPGTPPACALARNRGSLVSFHDADHGDGLAHDGAALAWCERVLAAAGVGDADGELWLLTYPRVLGVVFKPVSFWFAQRRDGSLAAVVAEVNNTFGERHSYVLAGAAWGRELSADKALHVSPFCAVAGGYRFRFMQRQGWQAGGRLIARVDHDDADGPLLQTSLSLRLQAMNRTSLLRVWLAMPLLTLGVLARIHWQALRLWLKRVPLHHKPPPPARLVNH
jgi:DUF1365 family protein